MPEAAVLEAARVGGADPFIRALPQGYQTLLSGLKATVEARSGGNTLAVPAAPGEDAGHYSATLNLAQPGDWVIKGVAGELYPCKPDIFAETYEPA